MWLREFEEVMMSEQFFDDVFVSRLRFFLGVFLAILGG